MFFAKKAETSELDKAINNLHTLMYNYLPESDEYSICIDQLTKLYAIKANQGRDRISKDTLAAVIGNLAGIVLIVGHERAHVVTSKALSFVMKAR